MQTHYGIMVIEYTVNLIEEMIIIIIWPGVCVFVIVSVPSKWLEGSSWFWQGGFPQPILLCVITKIQVPTKNMGTSLCNFVLTLRLKILP